jgi:hypothetical protein
MSQRRRARILEILADLLRSEEINRIEALLDDPVEAVRLNAARAVLSKGTGVQKERAFAVALLLLDSSDRGVRASSEEIQVEHFGVGYHLVEQEIRRRELAGESAQEFFPKESTLVILHRIRKKGRPLTETRH